MLGSAAVAAAAAAAVAAASLVIDLWLTVTSLPRPCGPRVHQTMPDLLNTG
jgi:hypothetical protein